MRNERSPRAGRMAAALAALLMLAAGCVPLPPEPAGAICLRPAEGEALFENGEHGYCVLYPDAFTVERPIADEAVLIGPVPEAGDRTRAFIKVTEAGGPDAAAQAAEAVVADVTTAMPDWEVERSEALLGGEPAVVLDGLPGQDINRRVFAAHGGKLYDLTFVPADPALGVQYEEMEALYETIMGSWAWME